MTNVHTTYGSFECVIGRRGDGHLFLFFYTPEQEQDLYAVLERYAESGWCGFNWDDFYFFREAVRLRLRQISEAGL